MPTSIRSYSKINLGLAIGAPRPDGFHALTTVYQTLAFHDVVTVEAGAAAATSITLTCSHPRTPTGASNTAWKMAERLLAELGRTARVHIHIEKRLPLEGGLGAGSANAVAALLGLEKELGAEASGPARLRLAAEIGSDVPPFLVGGSVLGVGRGEEVSALPDTPSMPCVLALPEVGISTPRAFRDWDALHRFSPTSIKASIKASGGGIPESAPDASLTTAAPSARMKALSRSIAVLFGEPRSSGVFSQRREGLAETPLLALVRTGIENDFEQVVFPQYPFLGEIKRVLQGEPNAGEAAVYAALSGSGSALFGLYHTVTAAQAALERLRARDVRGVLTRTLAREEYWLSMTVPSPAVG